MKKQESGLTLEKIAEEAARKISADWRSGSFRSKGGVVGGMTPIILSALSKVQVSNGDGLKNIDGLLPCPFCGGKAEIWGIERAPRGIDGGAPYLGVVAIVECMNETCAVKPQMMVREEYRSDTFDGYRKAIEEIKCKSLRLWNRRVSAGPADTRKGTRT